MSTAIILAGGLGTRLRSVVAQLPKALAPINGTPFLELQLINLARKGITKFILSLGYKAELIRCYFGDSFRGIPIIYAIESAPLGTGGAVRLAMEYVDDDFVFVCNGDTWLEFDMAIIQSALSCKRSDRWLPALVAVHVDDCSRYGRVEISENIVTEFRSATRSGPGFINGGCYIFPRGLLSDYPLSKVFSLEDDFLASISSKGKLFAFSSKGPFLDIGTPEDYAAAQLLLPRLLSLID